MDTKWYEYKPKQENRLIGHWHATLPKHDPALVIDHSMDNRSTDTCLKEAFQSIHWFFRVFFVAMSFSIFFEYISPNPRLFLGTKQITSSLVDWFTLWFALIRWVCFFPSCLTRQLAPLGDQKSHESCRPKMFAANSSLGKWESPIWFVDVCRQFIAQLILVTPKRKLTNVDPSVVCMVLAMAIFRIPLWFKKHPCCTKREVSPFNG